MIFSVGFAFAEDANQTDSDLGITDGEVISDVQVKSYNDLDAEMHKDAYVNLTADYTYNEASDNIKQVNLTGSAGKEYSINGNNHVIDGAGKAGALKFYSVKVTISNLTFKNCNRSAIEAYDNSTVILNNVIFINNNEAYYGGAIYADDAYITVNNCSFSENYAKYGAAISSRFSAVTINKSEFKNKNSMEWSLIYAFAGSAVEINDCTFENLKAKYATVAFATNSYLRTYNSMFANLSASATGGAIAVKNSNKLMLTVQNCEFENVHAAKNGGAIYIDANADSDAYLRGTSVINLTKFTNCSSEFGGAVLQLGGFMNVLNSIFTNNHAVFNGGAIYASNATFYTIGTTFYNNYGQYPNDLSKGGALYLDYSKDIEIKSSNFTDNKAYEGGAIYLYDTFFIISDSSSHNNGEFIHSYFPTEGSEFKNCDLDKSDKYILEDEYFPYVVDFEGKKIVLNPITIVGNVTDGYFDLRSFNATTPVKDQGSNGACWAFGTTGALESAFKMATGIALDISENYIQNSGLRYSIYGQPSITEGGYIGGGLGYVLSWLGIVSTEYDEYDELGKISQILFTPDSYHIADAIFLNTSNRTAIKHALINYGGLTIHVNGADPLNKYYNKQTHALYCDNKTSGNHFVTIVGWNDTYSRTNFIIDPDMDGAWIVKNSWGTDWGDGGYFYLSYADAPLLNANAVGYIINNTEVYNKLYQYDIAPLDGFLEYKGVNNLTYTHTYESIGNDLIAAVGTYFISDNISYTINVKVNGNLVYSQKGKALRYGFHTIPLNKTIAINKGDKFSIEIEVDCNRVPFSMDTRLFFQKGHSVVDTPKGHEDLANRRITASLKVYTLKNPNNVSGVKVYSNNISNLEIKSSIEGATVTIAKNGQSVATTTVKDGKAVFNATLESGNYTIITSYEDSEIMSSLEIYPTIIMDEEVTRTLNSDMYILIALIDVDGNILNNTAVSGNIDGKNITLGQTNAGGILIVHDLNLNIGAHLLTVFNPVTDDEEFMIINIASRFGSANNIVMDYFDGTRFKVRVYDDFAQPVAKGQKVTIVIKNKRYTAYSDAKGYVSFKIPNAVTPGSHTLKATFKGETISKTLKVKQVLKSKKTVTVKKSAKKLVLKATLKTSKNKAIKNKKIAFKFKGKTYKAKTNKKGVAKVTVKKKVIKKLKKGKKYSVKITYLKDTIKSTVKVKR